MSKRDVSPKIKEPRKQSKKPKKTSFFLQKKTKSRSMAALCYASKNPIHTPILLRHLDVSRKKKSNSKYGTGNHLIVHHPKNGSKKQPEPLN